MSTPTTTRAAVSPPARPRLPALAGALALAMALAAGTIDTARAQDESEEATTAEEAGDETESPAATTAESGSGAESGATAGGSDYPTTAIADYVLGCMVANGNSYEALQQCSCSIDFIKARLDYKSYEEAETILKVQRDTGQRGIFYRDSNWAKSRVERLEALQAESTLRCF